MNAIIVYQINSGFIPLIGLMDLSLTPPAYVNNTTAIAATLKDPSGLPVTGLTTVAGVYVPNSNGNYNFPVSSSFNPPAGGGYTLYVSVTAPSGAIANWAIPASVQVRGMAAYST